MDRSRAAFAAHRLIGMLGATALCVAPLLASAANVPLTLPEAQRQALERSQLLVARHAAIAGAREMAVAAAQLPDPVAKMQINNLPIDGEDRFSLTRDFMTMRSIGVMQEFTRSNKRKARAERFERDADKSKAESVLDAATIQRDTALAWLDRYYAESMPSALPGISVGKVSELLQQTDRLIKTVPEVATVFAKAGRAETATDPAPLEMFETTIQFKPREQWRPGMFATARCVRLLPFRTTEFDVTHEEWTVRSGARRFLESQRSHVVDSGVTALAVVEHFHAGICV